MPTPMELGAVELFLKSAFLKREYQEGDLRKYHYRHNLDALLKALQAQGVSVTPETVSLIIGLHLLHQNHTLRYTAFVDDGQKTYMPPTSFVCSLLDEWLLFTRISNSSHPHPRVMCLDIRAMAISPLFRCCSKPTIFFPTSGTAHPCPVLYGSVSSQDYTVLCEKSLTQMDRTVSLRHHFQKPVLTRDQPMAKMHVVCR